MALITPLTKKQAILELHRLFRKEESNVHLVPFQRFKAGKKIRSSRYESFDILCHNNTYKDAGWLVCKYAMSGSCKLENALLVFNTASGGTGRLERHMGLHKVFKGTVRTLPKSISTFSKREVARCAALAVALDLRPLFFTDDKRGLSHFAGAIFAAGQATPVNETIDPKSILPSGKAVSSALTKLVKDKCEEYKGLLSEILKTGGGVTTDGVTLKIQDKQFYDLTLHYISISSVSPFDMAPQIRMECRTLLLQEKKGNGSAEELRSLLNDGLKGRYGLDIDRLTKGFTMVTDNASVMARVARASVSTRIAPLGQKWMGCFVHQINTAMKCCIDNTANEDDLIEICNDLQAVKKIVRIFKQSNWNSLLPDGLRLVQEVETRFATTFHVVERFTKSASCVQETIDSNDPITAKSAFESLHKILQPCGAMVFPALEAILDAFRDLVQVQKEMEASTTPTIHLALPKLQICMDKLSSTAEGGSVYRGKARGFVPASPYSRRLCRSTLEWLQAKVRIHPLLMAGCFLNPLFREFQFLGDVNKRNTYRAGAETILRAMIAQQDDSAEVAQDLVPDEHDAATVMNDSDGQPGVAGRKRTFSLLSYADSLFQPSTPCDEISRYNHLDVSQLPIDREKYVRDSFGPVRFWYIHRATFPKLYKAALRLFAIHVSSCASERVFSAVKRTVSNDRTSMSSTTLEEIIIVRSLVSDM